jgi:hypothetical protein
MSKVLFQGELIGLNNQFARYSWNGIIMLIGSIKTLLPALPGWRKDKKV